MTSPARILVAGAGPAGLALALQAHDHGAEVRIVDRRPAAFRPSRALIMHPRTLEVLRPLGVTGALLARADTAPTADLRLGRQRAVQVRLAGFALPDTAFPYLSLIWQMDVETVLARALGQRGIGVERGTELVRVRDRGGDVQAVLRTPGRLEEVCFDAVAGCDGPASTVRAQAGIGWAGRPYPVEIVLADAELSGDLRPGAAHVAAGPGGLVFAFALGERASWRLLATRPAGADPLPYGQPGPPVPAAELQALLDQSALTARITGLAWSARVRVQHGLAGQFSAGRLYLAGEAAHAYSPATGQGMNAAIQDAANLGWKLALAAPGPPGAMLLGSYDQERRPAARQVLGLTHVAFWVEAATGCLPALIRSRVMPLAGPAVPALLGWRRPAAAGFRLISQLGVSYRGSPLSVEGTPRRHGGPRSGDRLPDQAVTCAGRRTRLHDLTARPGIHVLLDRDASWPAGLRPGPLVTVHRLSSVPGRGLLAVRPDGHVGFRSQVVVAGELAGWFAAVLPGITGNNPE
ncbi:MAG TPA: FAD-dependent monooxygenase [Streptosporangiaceae bacterium]|nr:FAD-dependent monooxygenase [Streptosporangiaceae bacterium]